MRVNIIDLGKYIVNKYSNKDFYFIYLKYLL